MSWQSRRPKTGLCEKPFRGATSRRAIARWTRGCWCTRNAGRTAMGLLPITGSRKNRDRKEVLTMQAKPLNAPLATSPLPGRHCGAGPRDLKITQHLLALAEAKGIEISDLR